MLLAGVGPVVRAWSQAATVEGGLDEIEADADTPIAWEEDTEPVDITLDPDRSQHVDVATTTLRHSLLVPKPGDERHLLGLLAGTADNLVFGVTRLIGTGHKGIAFQMKNAFGPLENIHWGGELVVLGQEERPLLTRVLNRSGFVSGNPPGYLKSPNFRDATVVNSNGVLIQSLQLASSVLATGSDTRVVPFQLGARTQHLHPVLNQRSLDLHTVGTHVGVCLSVINMVKSGIDFESVQAYLQDRFKEAALTTIYFCELMLSLGYDNACPWLTTLLQGLEKTLQGDEIKNGDLEALTEAGERIQKFYTVVTNDRGAEYDFFVL